MGFIAKDTGGGDYTPAPAGNHVARCVQMIDLGTQYSKFYDKEAHKVLIGWELPSEPNGDHGPHIVFKRYTLSLHENASLRKDLESWFGQKFTAGEAKGFDVSKVLGKACLLNVSHRGDNGKTYADVDAVAPLAKGMACPTMVTGIVKFDIDDPDMGVYETFGDKLKKTIADSAEWRAKGAGGASAPPAGQYDIPDDDSIPFS